MSAINANEWVEIPAGECIVGLSQRQKQHLRLRLVWTAVRQFWNSDLQQECRQAQRMLTRVPEQKAVWVQRFYVTRYPVTVEQYAQHLAKQNLVPTAAETRLLRLGWGKLPKLIDYAGALDFCIKAHCRLPSSLEWEKAARGVQGHLYPWGNTWQPQLGNVDRKRVLQYHHGRPLPNTWATEVDAFPAGKSPFGVLDLVGNAQEWTSDIRAAPTLPAAAYVVRKWPIRFSCALAWFYNLLALEHLLFDPQALNPERYMCFRAVRD